MTKARRPALAVVDLADVPAGDAWLGETEAAVSAGLAMPRRREQWRAGRWAARRAVGAWTGTPADGVEVLAAADGAPQAWRRGRRLRATVSISHRATRAACLVAAAGTLAGCDLELVEPRPAVFVDDWFTDAERSAVAELAADRRDLLVTLTWAGKEAAFKALRDGLRRATREAEVDADLLTAPDAAGWRPLRVTVDGGTFDGAWRVDDGLVLAVVARPWTGPPR